jgi:hypothetical protein
MTAPDTSLRARSTQIEADVFCASCGYNLHGQKIWLDERLGFLVCQCPECGRYHPAANGSSANSIWLSRFATGMLIVWIIAIIALSIIFGFIFAGFQAGFASFTQLNNFDGKYAFVIASDKDIAGQAWVIFFGALFGFLAGVLLPIFLWHWSRKWYWLGILVPTIAAAILTPTYLYSDVYHSIIGWIISRIWTLAGIEVFFLLLGTFVGRPIARAIIRAIVPPRPRQLLNFLWLIDGQQPPSPGQPWQNA